jgi:dTDP-glucose pyrophosphorylase
LKALILAAGKGKRLNDLCKDKNKCMTEVKGKPIIEHIFENLHKIGCIDEYVVVVGYKAESIAGHFGSSFKGGKIQYVYQPELNGVVSAIECARPMLEKHDFLLHLGDEYMFNPKHSEMIDRFHAGNYFALLGTLTVDNRELIKKTYSIQCNEHDRVTLLVEKPLHPFNNLMGTGNIVFNNGIFDYINETPVNPIRGEKELVDLIQVAVNKNKKVGIFEVAEDYINLNTVDEFRAISCL